jgi:hypothetical protein
MTDARALTRYKFDNSHRSSGVSVRAESLSCRHDLAGNLTQISDSDNTGSCTYGVRRQLRTLKEGSAGLIALLAEALLVPWSGWRNLPPSLRPSPVTLR